MTPRPLWMEQAACRGQTKTMALPDLCRDDGKRGGSYTVPQLEQIARARCICAHCPVLDDCRAWVLAEDDPAVGMVAAGMVPRQRDDIRKARRRGVA